MIMVVRAVAIGTSKGAYLLDRDLRVDQGPVFPGWKVTAWGTHPNGSLIAALASNWFGASLQRSEDLSTWEPITDGPSFGETRPLKQIWTLHATDDGTMLAGVEEAGVFSSADDGTTWSPVPALNDWPGREGWTPGLGGLGAHHVVTNGDRWWVGISAVGVFRSDDAGKTFVKADDGVTPAVPATDATDAGMCVHAIALDHRRPDHVWRQDHSGVYRTVDAGSTWERIENGLPSRFGFPIRRDAGSDRLFVVPMESDENRITAGGRFRVFQSDDDGDSWHVSGTGWSTRPSFDTVLRGAMATDGEGMVVLGSTGGNVWVTRDAGDSWSQVDAQLPRILSVAIVP